MKLKFLLEKPSNSLDQVLKSFEYQHQTFKKLDSWIKTDQNLDKFYTYLTTNYWGIGPRFYDPTIESLYYHLPADKTMKIKIILTSQNMQQTKKKIRVLD